jgi:hypothetical protein
MIDKLRRYGIGFVYKARDVPYVLSTVNAQPRLANAGVDRRN